MRYSFLASRWTRSLIAATVGGVALAAAQPALADHDKGWHKGHHKHRHHPPAYYYHPAPPPVVYYEPRRVYVAPPPPVYYAPPPGVSLNLNVPLR